MYWTRRGVTSSIPHNCFKTACSYHHVTDPSSGHGTALDYQQAVLVATQYAPAPLLPPWTPKPSRTAEQTQRSSTFPPRIRSDADRCSRLTR